MSKRRLFEKSRVLAQGSLLWVDQLQHLLGLPDNGFILVSSSLDQQLLEWLLEEHEKNTEKRQRTPFQKWQVSRVES